MSGHSAFTQSACGCKARAWHTCTHNQSSMRACARNCPFTLHAQEFAQISLLGGCICKYTRAHACTHAHTHARQAHACTHARTHNTHSTRTSMSWRRRWGRLLSAFALDPRALLTARLNSGRLRRMQRTH